MKVRTWSTEVCADDFYSELVTRNRPLIKGQAQSVLRRSWILVAGCGSTGGAAVEPLVRLGAEHLILAEPDVFELNNLNRQAASVSDVGRNKAVALRDRAYAINPNVHVRVIESGITDDNCASLLTSVAVILDGVDVTSMSGWRAKYRLHAEAARLGVPVIVGYDMSGVQYIRTYQYLPGDNPFCGKISYDDLEGSNHWLLLRKVIPLGVVPVDFLEGLLNSGEDEGFPQLTYTALQFGSLAARLVLRILEGKSVRQSVIMDVDRIVEPIIIRVMNRSLGSFRKARLLRLVISRYV